jgi:type VI secretion system protein
MREERLLERIRLQENAPARRATDDHRRCINSVLSHLQRILNTRQGNVLIGDDYGVPDFIDFLQNCPDSVRDIEHSIRAAIDKYEPRLSEVRVTFDSQEDDVLVLRFQIAARLSTDGGQPVYFETLLDTDGKIRVRR